MAYLAIDRSNELKHWKYTHRYRDKHGRWRYVYGNKNELRRVRKDRQYLEDEYPTKREVYEQAAREIRKDLINFDRETSNNYIYPVINDLENRSYYHYLKKNYQTELRTLTNEKLKEHAQSGKKKLNNYLNNIRK